MFINSYVGWYTDNHISQEKPFSAYIRPATILFQTYLVCWNYTKWNDILRLIETIVHQLLSFFNVWGIHSRFQRKDYTCRCQTELINFQISRTFPFWVLCSIYSSCIHDIKTAPGLSKDTVNCFIPVANAFLPTCIILCSTAFYPLLSASMH